MADALLRKPIQENLFLLEMIASDLPGFSDHFVGNPLGLRSQKAGGVDAYKRRIASVLRALDLGDRFDAGYLAQLRYDKGAGDGFDGICNTAIHLFTGHNAIRTENMNINFRTESRQQPSPMRKKWKKLPSATACACAARASAIRSGYRSRFLDPLIDDRVPAIAELADGVVAADALVVNVGA